MVHHFVVWEFEFCTIAFSPPIFKINRKISNVVLSAHTCMFVFLIIYVIELKIKKGQKELFVNLNMVKYLKDK